MRRAALLFSRVTVYNRSEVQTHVVIDRFSQGHTLRPGERKHGVELPNDEIAYFQEQRRPDRFYRLPPRRTAFPNSFISPSLM